MTYLLRGKKNSKIFVPKQNSKTCLKLSYNILKRYYSCELIFNYNIT